MRDPTLYVPSHAGIWTHRKFLRLCRLLGEGELMVFGGLHSLWHAAAAQTPDGVLIGWDAIDIAAAARWPGDSDEFVWALEAEGWLERGDGGVFVIHDWDEYAGQWREQREIRREQGKERVRKWRERHQAAGNTTGAVTPQEGNALPGVTSPPVTHREERRGEKKRGEERESGAFAPGTAPAPAGEASPPEDPAWLQRAEDRLRGPPRPGRLVRGRGVVGLAEQQAKPKTPEELIQRLPELRQRFAVFDGKGTRPRLEERLVALWEHWSRAYDESGPEVAKAKLVGWLATDAERFARGFARDVEAGQAGPAEDPKVKKLRERWRTRRGRGEDLPPFEPWRQRLEAEGTLEAELRGDPTPSFDGPDVPIRDLVRRAQVEARARAGPASGGTAVGGGMATAAEAD